MKYAYFKAEYRMNLAQQEVRAALAQAQAQADIAKKRLQTARTALLNARAVYEAVRQQDS